MLTLDNVTCTDGYPTGSGGAQLGPVFNSSGGYLLLETNDAFVQIGYGRQGAWQWTNELHASPGAYALDPGVIAIRARNYTAGKNAVILSAALATAAEPRPFVPTAAGFGSTSPSAGGTTNVSEERRIAVNLTNPYVAADPGNSYPFVQALTGADLGAWAFLNGVEGKVFGNVQVPAKYDSTFAASLILAVASAAGTGNVALQVGTSQLASGSSFSTVTWLVGATQVQPIGAALTMYYVSFALSALTATDLLLVEVIRAGQLASDTLANVMLLLGAWLDCTVTF